MNIDIIQANVRRYGRASFERGGSLYEVVGSVRTKFSLWLCARTPYGVRRTDMLAQFNQLHELNAFFQESK